MQPQLEKKALYDELIKGCLKSDRAAQKKLYEYMSPTMFAICLRYGDDYHTAEDLLQEGFVKVFRYISNYRGEGSFEGWVKRIFVNTAIEQFRKNSKMYPIVNLESVEHGIEAAGAGSSLELEDLQNLIRKLSPGYRTVFNLYVVEGYSHKEISETLDISEGTSKSQLARARYLLQKMILESETSTRIVELHEAVAK